MAFRRSSREIVDGDRPSRRAICTDPALRAFNNAISSRSANDKKRPDGGTKLIEGMPPPWRNHRVPTGADTPHATAASSLVKPSAIFAQNRRSTSRLTLGRPGDRIGRCNDRPALRAHLLFADNTPP